MGISEAFVKGHNSKIAGKRVGTLQARDRVVPGLESERIVA
jgi:hypothetical protein